MSRWHIHWFRYDGFDPLRGSILICRCGEVRYSGTPGEELRAAAQRLGGAMLQRENAAVHVNEIEAARLQVAALEELGRDVDPRLRKLAES